MIEVEAVAGPSVVLSVDVVATQGGGGGGAVDSVNAKTGTVVLTASDVGADASGAASSAVSALSSVYQPLDSDLTAIALLSTTSYGRAFLALADASAARTALGLGTAATTASSAYEAAGAVAALSSVYQPLDSDLTSIAALATTAFGRGLLALADAAALRTAAGLGGAATLSVGTTTGTVAAGDDSRFTDARVPSGSAGGALGGTYPNPTITDGTIANAKLTTNPLARANHTGTQTMSTISDAGGAATKNVGTTTGTVAAGDDSRFIKSLFFGDGADGAVTVTQSSNPAWQSKSGSGATTLMTLIRDVYFTDLTLDASGGVFTIRTAGFRIFVSGTLTLGTGIVIQHDGNAAAAGVAGVNLTAATVGTATGAGSAGGVGVAATQATAITASIATTNTSATAHGGTGGASTGGGTGGGVAGGTTANAATNGRPSSTINAIQTRGTNGTAWTGGGGGTGGTAAASSTGGGGGGGAGIVAIFARTIVNNGTIRAKGGAGGNATLGAGAGAGGGGGGGGGAIILVYMTSGSTVGSTDVTGGTGGTLAGTGATGATGSSGLVWQVTF